MYKFINSTVMKLLGVINYDTRIRGVLHRRTRCHLTEIPAKITVNLAAILLISVAVKGNKIRVIILIYFWTLNRTARWRTSGKWSLVLWVRVIIWNHFRFRIVFVKELLVASVLVFFVVFVRGDNWEGVVWVVVAWIGAKFVFIYGVVDFVCLSLCKGGCGEVFGKLRWSLVDVQD